MTAALRASSDPDAERVIRGQLLDSAAAMRARASGPTIACAHLSAASRLLVDQVGLAGARAALVAVAAGLTAAGGPIEG